MSLDIIMLAGGGGGDARDVLVKLALEMHGIGSFLREKRQCRLTSLIRRTAVLVKFARRL